MPTKTKIKAIIAIYSSHPEAERAIQQLDKTNFDMRKLSIVGRDFQKDEQVIGYYNSGDRMRYWGKVGAFWGGVDVRDESRTYLRGKGGAKTEADSLRE